MSAIRSFQVCLAGPIGACNEVQKHGWRQELKRKCLPDSHFIDLTETSVPVENSSDELVGHSRGDRES